MKSTQFNLFTSNSWYRVPQRLWYSRYSIGTVCLNSDILRIARLYFCKKILLDLISDIGCLQKGRKNEADDGIYVHGQNLGSRTLGSSTRSAARESIVISPVATSKIFNLHSPEILMLLSQTWRNPDNVYVGLYIFRVNVLAEESPIKESFVYSFIAHAIVHRYRAPASTIALLSTELSL